MQLRLQRTSGVGRETSMESISGQEGILSQQSGLMKKLAKADLLNDIKNT